MGGKLFKGNSKTRTQVLLDPIPVVQPESLPDTKTEGVIKISIVGDRAIGIPFY
jgi:hypothetical protein